MTLTTDTASVLAAFSNSAEMLIFCRALLGVAAARLCAVDALPEVATPA